jgi:hypothetical protein
MIVNEQHDKSFRRLHNNVHCIWRGSRFHTFCSKGCLIVPKSTTTCFCQSQTRQALCCHPAIQCPAHCLQDAEIYGTNENATPKAGYHVRRKKDNDVFVSCEERSGYLSSHGRTAGAPRVAVAKYVGAFQRKACRETGRCRAEARL